MTTTNLTRRALSLGTRDTVTGWPAYTYTNTTIRGLIQNQGHQTTLLPAGLYTKYPCTGFFPDVVHVGDEIVDSSSTYYSVLSAEQVWIADQFQGYVCELQKNSFPADQPATSGTWHLDSESLRTDSRYRHKTYINTYLTANNLKEDNNVTNASYALMFANPRHPFRMEFIDNGVDLLFCFDKTTAAPLTEHNHKMYAFEESVPITICAINKSGITAENLVEKGEQEIRRIVTTYPTASGVFRGIEKSEFKQVDLGSTTMVTQTVTIKYKRSNDDFTPTAPAFDYGIAYIYEGDRLSGGTEGAWTLTTGSGSTCAQTITSDKNLYLNQTVHSNDSYTVNGTNLGLLTSLVPYVRFRYKTSGNATAKIIIEYSDASTTEVLSETASSTFTVETAALASSKTVDHIYFYTCDGVGTVTYDFIEFYAGTYICPNCTLLDPPVMVNDTLTKLPGGSDYTSPMGNGLMEVTTEHDLDAQPAALTWRIPQTTSPKSTDFPSNHDVLLFTSHRGGFYELWTWLKIVSPDMQVKARLVNMQPSYTGDEGKIRLTWREYRHGNVKNETSIERFGTTL